MAMTKLTLAMLKDLDMGRVAAGFQKELDHIVKDCEDRPGDVRARQVTLKLSLVPDSDGMGVCETVQGEFSITSSVPNRVSKKYQMRVHANGSLLFNPESPEDVTQGTLDSLLSEGEGDDADATPPPATGKKKK